jgi:hypothetical protein
MKLGLCNPVDDRKDGRLIYHLSRLKGADEGYDLTGLSAPLQRMISLLSLLSVGHEGDVEVILWNTKFDLNKDCGIDEFLYPPFRTDACHFNAPFRC